MDELEDMTHLMPYFMLEIIRSNGGWIDLDAKSIRDSIENEEEAKLVVYIANGKIILEIENFEGTTSEQTSETPNES